MFSPWWISNSLNKFLIAIAACSICLMAGNPEPGWSETKGIVIDMPLDSPIMDSYGDLKIEAGLLAENTINHQFSQNTEISAIQVVIMGNRKGDVIPIMTTNVSRSQWQENPQVKAWTQYYDAAYTLLQRHDLGQVARVRTTSIKSGGTMLQSDIDKALDEGSLTGAATQEHLSNLD